MLRGFYALERTRTVFWIQCAVAATNIVVAVAAGARRPTPPTPRRPWSSPTARRTSSGSVISYAVLRRVARRPADPDAGAVPGPAADRRRRLDRGGRRRRRTSCTGSTSPSRSWSVAAVWVLVVTVVDVVVFVVLARALRLREVTAVVDTVTRRLPLLAPALSVALRWPWATSRGLTTATRGAACRARSGPATCSPTGTAWSTCSPRAGAAGSGAPTTGSSSGTSRCTSSPPTTSAPTALLDAARRSATVHDRRLLRVLDADKADGLCYVVNEWGSGDSLDIMLAGDGPLGPRRAAWLVSEVAASIAVGHEAGVAHGRLIPENVLVDHTGGGPADRLRRRRRHARPAAGPGLHRRRRPRRPALLRADRQVARYVAAPPSRPRRSSRARCCGRGRSAPGSPGRSTRCATRWSTRTPAPGATGCARPTTWPPPRASRDYLCAFVGDPTGLAAAEAAAGHRDTETISLPAGRRPAGARAGTRRRPAPEPEPEPGAGGPEPPTDLPTQAGLPIFDDENDDVSWIDRPRRAGAAPAAVRGAARAAAVRAPSPPSGPTRTPAAPAEPARGRAGRPRRSGPGTPAPAPAPPRDRPPSRPSRRCPGRNWLRLAAVIAACLLLLVAVVVAYNLGRGRTPLGAVPDDDPDPTPSATSPSASAPPRSRSRGSPPPTSTRRATRREENPELAPLAVDGDPDTTWRTPTYLQNFGPGGLKTGVGLVLDLGAAQRRRVGRPHASSARPPAFSLYVTDQAPTAIQGLDAGGRPRSPTAPAPASPWTSRVTGRFLIVWLTSLPDGRRTASAARSPR